VWLQVLAKMESRQSLYAFKDIAFASDGVIMSRGNLGLDVVPEKMALIQKVSVMRVALSCQMGVGCACCAMPWMMPYHG
jgi:pyruvate kinase